MRFGILSTAGIARKALLPAIDASDHEVGAVASRSTDRAEQFAADHDIPTAYGDYAALLDDDSLDAVYIPLPNGLHAEWTRRAADAGLHVLCEKPLAVDADEAREVVDYCADCDVALMEAFMYRFHPRTQRALEIVETELGEVRSVTATFSFYLDDAGDVRLSPELAGGSVMDVGCYAVDAARQFLGTPDHVSAWTADDRNAGVDTRMAATLAYDTGQFAQVSSGFDTPNGPTTECYRVDTTEGSLVAETAFGPDAETSVALRYTVDGRTVTERFDPTDHYRLQVEAFADAVDAGEAVPVDPAGSVRTMAVVDAIYESAERGERVAVTPPE